MSQKPGPQPHQPLTAAAAAAPVPMSSEMQAVLRLMAGKEERTIAEKLADSNRPTWEQYKKDNSDKLNLEGADQRQMAEYRRELDAQRDKMLARGTNHRRNKKKKRQGSDSDSDSDGSRRRRRKKKHKKKHKRKKKRRRESDDSSSDDESSEDSRRERKRTHKRKKKSKDDGDSDGSHYRLSNFFNQDDSD